MKTRGTPLCWCAPTLAIGAQEQHCSLIILTPPFLKRLWDVSIFWGKRLLLHTVGYFPGQNQPYFSYERYSFYRSHSTQKMQMWWAGRRETHTGTVWSKDEAFIKGMEERWETSLCFGFMCENHKLYFSLAFPKHFLPYTGTPRQPCHHCSTALRSSRALRINQCALVFPSTKWILLISGWLWSVLMVL